MILILVIMPVYYLIKIRTIYKKLEEYHKMGHYLTERYDSDKVEFFLHDERVLTKNKDKK
jgi:hypothetical protein